MQARTRCPRRHYDSGRAREAGESSQATPTKTATSARMTDGDAMSMVMRTDTQSAAPHGADSHDLIRVLGARVNNLKDLSVDIPKRRLTVFTGVSGSGKSSLVFGTIAAESQRLINETYSAFVQGFMPMLARPEVDVLEGLTTDHRRPGADGRRHPLHGRHRHRRPRDAAHPSSAGSGSRASARPTHSPSTYPRSGPGCDHRRARRRPDRAKDLHPHRRHVPALRGPGLGHRLRPVSAVRRQQVAQTGRAHRPGLQQGRLVRPHLHGLRLLRPDKPNRKYTEKELHDLLYKEPTRIKVDGINLTYEGLIPRIQKSYLSKDREAMQPHIREFVDRAATFTACPACGGTRLSEAARSSRIGGINIADACAMQISDLAEWVRGLDEPSVAPLLAALQQILDSFVEIGLGYLGLDRPSGTLSGGEAQRTKMVRPSTSCGPAAR
jgi:energy-coupling factor transporter ATP-binding protein EcfA2